VSAAPIPVADQLAIAQQVARSHQLLDDRRCDELVDDVFAPGGDGFEPSADFGFDAWTGTVGLRAGYARSLARFEAAVHITGNLHLAAEADGAVTASYDLQGWHWLASSSAAGARPADFLLLGRMTDRFRRFDAGWRIVERTLRRHGPSVAVGQLPDWLTGLGAPTAAAGGLR